MAKIYGFYVGRKSVLSFCRWEWRTVGVYFIRLRSDVGYCGSGLMGCREFLFFLNLWSLK